MQGTLCALKDTVSTDTSFIHEANECLLHGVNDDGTVVVTQYHIHYGCRDGNLYFCSICTFTVYLAGNFASTNFCESSIVSREKFP